MNKLFTKLAAGFIGLTLVASVGAVIGSKALEKAPIEANAADTYVKASSIAVGDKVVLVSETAGMEMTSISTSSTKYGVGTAFSGSPAGTFAFDVVTGSEANSYSFKNGSNYLRWNSGNSLDIVATSVAKNSSWFVSFDGNSNAQLTNANDSTRFILWNKSSPRFATYAGQSVGNSYYATQLYKKDSGSTKTLEYISISGSMTNTTYTTNDDWDPAGLTVTAHYDDSSTDDVTNSATWSFAPSKPSEGVTSVIATATYSDEEASSTAQSVTVTKADPRIDITPSSYTPPASSYAAVEWASGGVGGLIYTTNNTSQIQFQANTSYIYNSIAISGYITNITIECASGKSISGLTAFVGKNSALTAKPGTGGISNSTDWIWNFNENDNYCYFRIDSTSSGAKYFSHIYVTYKEVSLVDPTGITLDDSSAISMDTYGYGKRTLNATVEPFNANDKTVTWGSSNPSVVTVSNGVLSPTGVGTTTVYGTTCNYVDDATTPNLKASVSVTVTQAQYKKATFVPKSTSTLTSEDDYLVAGSASVSSDGQYSNEKSAIQLGSGKNATFTISNYTGMKIFGIDLVMSSNASSGAGSLEVQIGSTNVYSIEACAFSNPKWNGAFSAVGVNLYKEFASEVIVTTGEDIILTFDGTIGSLYIHSVAIRYLDASLEQWCQSFLDDYVCDPQGVTRPSTDDWDDFGIEFIYLDDDLQELARNTTAKESGNTIEKAMYKYDYIIGKYGDLEDPTTGAKLYDNYIERTPIQMSLIRTSNILGANENDSITLIVVVAVISLTAVGAFFYIRRRRQHN